MNYYEHHLGDYLRDTAHLTMVEDGAYRRLLDAYYIREEPLPLLRRDLYRLARAQSKADRNAVDTVLEEFFTETAEGWRHARCDHEIARTTDKRRKAQESANARWSGQRPQYDGNANASPDAMRTHSEGNALQTPDSRHQIRNTPSPAGARAREIGEPANLNREAFQRWELYLEAEAGKPVGLFSRPGVMRQLVAFGDHDQQAAVVENCINRRSKNLHPLDRPMVVNGTPGPADQSRRKTKYEQLQDHLGAKEFENHDPLA